jgi:hypothetical protein
MIHQHFHVKAACFELVGFFNIAFAWSSTGTTHRSAHVAHAGHFSARNGHRRPGDTSSRRGCGGWPGSGTTSSTGVCVIAKLFGRIEAGTQCGATTHPAGHRSAHSAAAHPADSGHHHGARRGTGGTCADRRHTNARPWSSATCRGTRGRRCTAGRLTTARRSATQLGIQNLLDHRIDDGVAIVLFIDLIDRMKQSLIEPQIFLDFPDQLAGGGDLLAS